MIAHLVLTGERGRRPRLSREQVLGLTLLRVEAPVPPKAGERALHRSVDRAARLLAAEGCRRVLVEEEFAHWNVLREYGLAGVEPDGLCQQFAAPLALAALEGREILPGRATVALRGGRVSRLFFQAALELAPRVRALMISAAAGGEELAAHLRRELGIPVLEEGSGRPADLALEFSPAAAQGGDVLRLYTPVDLPNLHIILKEGTLPDHVQPLPLAAALWEAGVAEKGAFSCLYKLT